MKNLSLNFLPNQNFPCPRNRPNQFSQIVGEWRENQILIPDCPGATLATHHNFVKIDEGQQKRKIVRTNRYGVELHLGWLFTNCCSSLFFFPLAEHPLMAGGCRNQAATFATFPGSRRRPAVRPYFLALDSPAQSQL